MEYPDATCRCTKLSVPLVRPLVRPLVMVVVMVIPVVTPRSPGSSRRGDRLRQRDRRRDAEEVLDDLEEHLGLAQQVVGLACADVTAAVDDRPVRRAGGEEGGPLPQLRGH